MLTEGEAVVLTHRALKCLRQGEADPQTMPAARAFAELTMAQLVEEKWYAEANEICRKLIDNNLR